MLPHPPNNEKGRNILQVRIAYELGLHISSLGTFLNACHL